VLRALLSTPQAVPSPWGGTTLQSNLLFSTALCLEQECWGPVGIATLKPMWVKRVTQGSSLQTDITALFYSTSKAPEPLQAGSWAACLARRRAGEQAGRCTASCLELDPGWNNTIGSRYRAGLSSVAQEGNPPPPAPHLQYCWNCDFFFVSWKLKPDELLQYACSWKLQLLRSECQPSCWWAHLLYFICFAIQIFETISVHIQSIQLRH